LERYHYQQQLPRFVVAFVFVGAKLQRQILSLVLAYESLREKKKKNQNNMKEKANQQNELQTVTP